MAFHWQIPAVSFQDEMGGKLKDEYHGLIEL